MAQCINRENLEASFRQIATIAALTVKGTAPTPISISYKSWFKCWTDKRRNNRNYNSNERLCRISSSYKWIKCSKRCF